MCFMVLPIPTTASALLWTIVPSAVLGSPPPAHKFFSGHNNSGDACRKAIQRAITHIWPSCFPSNWFSALVPEQSFLILEIALGQTVEATSCTKVTQFILSVSPRFMVSLSNLYPTVIEPDASTVLVLQEMIEHTLWQRHEWSHLYQLSAYSNINIVVYHSSQSFNFAMQLHKWRSRGIIVG